MRYKDGFGLLLCGLLSLQGCASSETDDALPRADRYEPSDLQQMASSLQSTGQYHDAFGLEVHAKNVRLLSENALLLQSDQDGTPVFIRHRSPNDTTSAATKRTPTTESSISLPDMLASGVEAHDALISLSLPSPRGYLDVRVWHVSLPDGHTCGEIEFNTNKAYFGRSR